jgi:hypothetical protein
VSRFVLPVFSPVFAKCQWTPLVVTSSATPLARWEISRSFSSLTPLFFYPKQMSREGSSISHRLHLQLIPTSSSFSPPVDPAWRRYDFPSPIPHSPSPRSSILPAVRIGFQAAAAPGSVQFERRQRSVAVLAAASRHRADRWCVFFFFRCSSLPWLGVTQSRSWYTLFPERSSSSPLCRVLLLGARLRAGIARVIE